MINDIIVLNKLIETNENNLIKLYTELIDLTNKRQIVFEDWEKEKNENRKTVLSNSLKTYETRRNAMKIKYFEIKKRLIDYNTRLNTQPNTENLLTDAKKETYSTRPPDKTNGETNKGIK